MRIQHWIYAVPLRLRSLFRRNEVEQEMDDELEYHLERKIEENLAKGLTPEESRYAALRAMDSLSQRKEEIRDMRGVNAIEDTVQDIRYSLRVLRKSPGFTVVAVLTLALAIGANAVVFSILNALILRPMDIPHPESLYTIEHSSISLEFSYPDYLDLRDRNRSFDGLAAYNNSQVGLDTGANPTPAFVDEVTGNYFDVFGIQPFLGRFIEPSDEHNPYIVLTYAYWHTHFQDDRGVVGRRVQLNKRPFTIIGVAPPGFHGPVLFFGPDFFVPIERQNTPSERGNPSLLMTIGHLMPGVTPQQAIGDLNSIGAYLEKTYPTTDAKMSFKLARPFLFGDFATTGTRNFLTALMLLAGLILLAACANLGSLFAARASDRSREVALRLALGASRTRILRTLFTEALLISLLGGAFGIWGGAVLLSGLSAWQPVPKYPVHMDVYPDATVYAVALLLTLTSGFLFGVVPVRQVLQTNPYQMIKAGSRTTRDRRITARDLLLVVQIAICAVLITSSLVAVRGFARSLNSNFGFDSKNVMLMDTDLRMAGYRDNAEPEMQKRMLDAIQTIPGVASVGLADLTPLNGSLNNSIVFTADTADLRSANAAAHVVKYSVSPVYFQAAATPLLSGRAFTWHDDRNAPPVAVINQELARRLFGSINNVTGKYYKLQDGTRAQVVGIVETAKYQTLIEDPQPAMFLPILQSPASATTLVVRSNLDPRQLAATMRNKLRDLDPGLPSFIQTWNNGLGVALFPPRMATIALGVMGIMGAMLSITGIFGMAAYSVSKRLKELGIRMALGAQRKEVLRAALGRALKLLAVGSTAGLVLGILASQVITSIVYQATPSDPLVLTAAVLGMALLGLLATWIPALRALSLDPMKLLREE